MEIHKLVKLWVAAILISSPAVLGQDASYRVSKAKVFVQTSDAAPVAAASGGLIFSASSPGFGGATLGFTSQVKLPGGAVKPLVYDSVSGLSLIGATNDTTAGLNATYPAGPYVFTISGSGQSFSGTVNLPADNYPIAPQVASFAAVKGADASQAVQFDLKPNSGAASNDELSLQVFNGAQEIYSDSNSGDTTSVSLFQGLLSDNKTYQVRVRYGRIIADAGTFPATEYVFYSETRFDLITKAAGGGVTNLPPVLVSAYPTNGSVKVSAYQTAAFIFSTPMDTTKVGLQWTGLDASKFNYIWADNDTTLICSFTGAGGMPASTITWSMNATAGGVNNFRDKNGNLLTGGPYQGSFTVQGAILTCTGSTAAETAGFGIIKQINHLQSGTGAPVNDPLNGALIFAFSNIPNATGIPALEFPASPAPLPHKLDFFQGSVSQFHILTNGYATRSDLDNAFPAQDYDFELRNPPTVVVAHAVLTLVANGYPTTPHFTSYTAAQAVNTNADFTLSWDSFASATGVDSLQVQILDTNGVVVFTAPNACDNRPLPVTATSVVIPAGTLKENQSYTAQLTFFHINDSGKVMSGTTTKGIAAVSRVTSMPLVTTGRLLPATPPVLKVLNVALNGDLTIQVQATAGRLFTLETSPGIGQPFTTLNTTNSAASPFVLIVSPGGAAKTFLRGRTD